MSEWQSIETAPTGEYEPILTWDGISYDVSYVGWWDEGKPVWFNGNCTIEPTHWLPLPESPK